MDCRSQASDTSRSVNDGTCHRADHRCGLCQGASKRILSTAPVRRPDIPWGGAQQIVDPVGQPGELR
jgi:hypothetical protein